MHVNFNINAIAQTSTTDVMVSSPYSTAKYLRVSKGTEWTIAEFNGSEPKTMGTVVSAEEVGKFIFSHHPEYFEQGTRYGITNNMLLERWKLESLNPSALLKAEAENLNMAVVYLDRFLALSGAKDTQKSPRAQTANLKHTWYPTCLRRKILVSGASKEETITIRVIASPFEENTWEINFDGFFYLTPYQLHEINKVHHAVLEQFKSEGHFIKNVLAGSAMRM